MANRKNMRKNTRKNRKTNRKSRRVNRRNRRQNGGSEPAPTVGNPMAGMQMQSLNQGKQFDAYHANQHGGALEGGPFPGAIVEPSILPQALHASARVAPIDAAIAQIQNLKDQSGGRRGRNRKGRKASRKGRKGSRKSRNTRRYRGGAYDLANAQSVSAPGMLLSPALEARALNGMNAEWKLAENPMAFAPGYSKQ
jgi:hypothetical protein